MRLSLGCSLWVSVFLLDASDSSQQRCLSSDNDTTTFLPFTKPPDQPLVVHPEDGLGPLYKFAQAFLEAVQPNAFPTDIISKALKNEQQDIPQLLQYEAGYLVCLILAVLYLLLMPIAGGILAKRHFHSRKSQMSNQPPTSTTSYYKHIAVSGCLILITLLLLTGVILAFSVNNRSRANMRPSLHHLHTNVRIVEDSLHSIPQKMEAIVEQYNIPQSEISKAIHETDVTIGAAIFTYFNSDVQKALTRLSSAVRDAVGSIDNLQTIEMTRTSMQSRHRTLKRELQQLQSRLENLKRCTFCDVPDSSNLETDADYSQIPSVQDKLDSMPPKRDLEGLVEQGDAAFHGIPLICSDQMAPTIAALLSELDKTQESMTNAIRSFPSLQSFSEVVSELRTLIRRSEGSIDYYDYVRWAVAVTLCTVMMVIVLLMVAALSIGLPVLFNPTVYSFCPDGRLERTALSLFQVSMMLSFAFSWLFIILVFVTLFLGGNAHTLGCRSFTRGQIFTFLDQQKDFFSSLNVSQGNQTVQFHPSTSEVYQGCLRGRSMFHSMDMDQLFDLEDFLNSTKYLEGFSKTAQYMSVNMDDLKLLSDRGREGLLDFRHTGLDNFNYDTMLLLLSKPVVKRDLAALAQELDEKAELPQNEFIKADLQEEATKARQLHGLVSQQTADAVKMSSSVRALRDISKTYKGHVDKTLSSFSQIEAAMRGQVPDIVANVSQCILEKAERCLLRYLDWLHHAILNEVMGCRWLARSIDNVYTAVCLNVIDPLNGFWLSLGWCCACLVPGMILIIYVTTHLRPVPPTTTFIGKDTLILPVHQDEKRHTEKEDTEKTKPNIYMTLEELHDDLSFKVEQMKGKCEDT